MTYRILVRGGDLDYIQPNNVYTYNTTNKLLNETIAHSAFIHNFHEYHTRGGKLGP